MTIARSLCLLGALGLFSSSAMSASLSRSGVQAEATPQQPFGTACGPVQLQQTTSNAITPQNSVSCNAGGIHTDNSYFRAYSLASYPAGFDVCAVTVGIETAASGLQANRPAGGGPGQPLTVRLYSNVGGAFPAGTRTQVGSATVTVADQSGTLLNVPVTGSLPAGAELVVEAFTPDGTAGGNSFFIGSNNLGQSGPSYLQAPDCGVTAPTTTAAIGFPNVQIVLNAVGTPVAAAAPVAAPGPGPFALSLLVLSLLGIGATVLTRRHG